jgi:hypothetical protein
MFGNLQLLSSNNCCLWLSEAPSFVQSTFDIVWTLTWLPGTTVICNNCLWFRHFRFAGCHCNLIIITMKLAHNNLNWLLTCSSIEMCQKDKGDPKKWLRNKITMWIDNGMAKWLSLIHIITWVDVTMNYLSFQCIYSPWLFLWMSNYLLLRRTSRLYRLGL